MHVNDRFKNKKKTKSCHIQIDDLAHKNAMKIKENLKDGVTVSRHSQKKDFLSIIIVRTPTPSFSLLKKGK